MNITDKKIRLEDLRQWVEEGLDSQVKHIEYCQEIKRLEQEIDELKLLESKAKVWIDLKDGWRMRTYKHGP